MKCPTKQTILTKYYRYLLLNFALFVPVFAAAQQIEANYMSISDGLPSPNVKTVFQDSYGLMWFGTENGLQKYDGYTFVTYKNNPGDPHSLANNSVWSIVEDQDHDLWLATDEGISRLDRQTRKFTNYIFFDIFNMPADGSWVLKLHIDSQGEIWAASQSMELVRYDPEADTWKLAKYDIPGVPEEGRAVLNLMFAIAEDGEGGLWVGSHTYGLLHRARGEEAFRPAIMDPSVTVDFTDDSQKISAFYVDRDGIIWITIRNGVFKYNPETHLVTTIKTYEENQTSVWNNMNDIFEDHEGNIWVVNNFRGILKFEGNSDHNQEMPVSGVMKMKNVGNTVTFTHGIVDRSGIIWIGSRTNGVLKYDPDKKPFIHYTHNESDPNSLSMNSVFGLLASKVRPNTLYVGTGGKGLNIFDEKAGTFQHVTYKAVNDFYGGAVRSIGEASDGTVYLGTWGDGIIELDDRWKEKKRYTYEEENENTISNGRVRVMEKDDQDNFWVGTNNGLNYFDTGDGTFKRIRSISTQTWPDAFFDQIDRWSESNQTAARIVDVTDFQDLSQEFEVTDPGKYLIASFGEGDRRSMADYGYLVGGNNDTLWISMDMDSTMYLGGAIKNRGEFTRLDLQPGHYELKYHSDDSHSYDKWNESPPTKTTLYGAVAIRLSHDDDDLIDHLMDRREVEMFISGNNILSLKKAGQYLWVGTDQDGLSRVDLTDHTVKIYKVDPEKENSLKSNKIYGIEVDSKGMIWLATNAGLHKLEPDTEVFTHYGEIDGLPTNLLESLAIGDDDDVWISTQNGLSQMVKNENLGKVTFINYNSMDGLGGDMFLSQVAAVMPGGRFYFGGDHGLNAVSKVKVDDVPPDIIVSDLLISNQSVYDMGEESPLDSNLLATSEITLTHNQNNLSFEFAALHYANPEKNQYAHMLKGYDKEWLYDNRSYAAYTNLDPGSYEFKVRASNAYGIWNEEGESIKFNILAPWYQTWWAYTLYVLLLALAIFLFDRSMRKRLLRKERERSREIELAQAREIEKAYKELKSAQSQLIQSEKMASLGELTAGIAHEIQNPLNFVNNFSEVSSELLQEMKEELKNDHKEDAIEIADDLRLNLEKINHHGKRASIIIKSMLEHSRTDEGKKVLTDINALCDEYLRLAYHGMRAKDKSFNVSIETNFDPALPLVEVVPQNMGRVLLNLINNAFYACTERRSLSVVEMSRSAVAEKKRPREHVPLENAKDLPGIQNRTDLDAYQPTITVSTKLSPAGGGQRMVSPSGGGLKGEDSIQISISDNGPGIPPGIKDKIFQPFFTTKPTGKGTGLGLSLSYDIVKAHGGVIKVESTEGEGTEFTIQLSVG